MICEEPALYPGERDRLRLDCRLRILCKGSRASQNITSVAAKALVSTLYDICSIFPDIFSARSRSCVIFHVPQNDFFLFNGKILGKFLDEASIELFSS